MFATIGRSLYKAEACPQFGLVRTTRAPISASELAVELANPTRDGRPATALKLELDTDVDEFLRSKARIL